MAQAKIRMMVGRRAGLTSPPMISAPQGTAATFVPGAPVKYSSGTLVAVSTTASIGASSALTVVKKSSTSNIIGIAEGDADASSTSNLAVALIAEGQEFVGNLVHNAASSAKVSKVGSTVYMGKATTDTHWGWSLTAPGASSASYVKGTIVGLVDAASTVNGRVLVKVTGGGALIT